MTIQGLMRTSLTCPIWQKCFHFHEPNLCWSLFSNFLWWLLENRITLPESPPLPSVWSTQQSLKNTRQRLCRVSHSTKKARHTVHRQSLLCRVLFIGHSAKRSAECQTALGKEKQPLRRRMTETASLPSVPGDTRQRSYLYRVPPGTLGKEPAREGLHVRFFVEC
jgi:hypothetical protein